MKRITITCVDPSDATYTGTIVKDEEIYNYFNLEAEADKSIARNGLDGNMYKFALRASLHDLRANYGLYAYELFVALIGILTYNTLHAVAFMLITLAAQYAVFIKGVRRVITILMFIPVLAFGSKVRKTGHEIIDVVCAETFFIITSILLDKGSKVKSAAQGRYIVKYDDFKSYMQKRLDTQYRDLQSNIVNLKVLRYALANDIYDNTCDIEYDFKRF